jgi:hypothetical protein
VGSDVMVGIANIAKLPDGRFQRLDILADVGEDIILTQLIRRIDDPVTSSAAPSISGTITPGQTVTAVAGTYSGAATTRERFRWIQLTEDGETYASADGATFLIASASPSGTLRLREDLITAAGVRYSFFSTVATISAGTGIPSFTVNPSLSGTGLVNGVLTATSGVATGTPAPTLTFQWFFNGSQRTSVTGSTYTPVTADIGSTIQVRQRAQNTAGTVWSPLTSGITITGVTGNVINVASLTELATGLNGSGASGSEFRLASGTFTGGLSLSGRQYSQRVTITAQDLGDQPVIRGAFNFANCRNFTARALQFISAQRSTTRFQSTVEFPDGGFVPADNTSAFILNDCQDFLITQCLSQFHHVPFSTRDVQNGEFTNNTIEYMGRDGWASYGMHRNIRYAFNLIWKTFIHVAGTAESNRHADGIQFGTNRGDPRNINVLCEHNYIETTQVVGMHGIFSANNAVRPTDQGGGSSTPGGQGLPFFDYQSGGQTIAGQSNQNYTVRFNFIKINHIQGVAIEGVDVGLIEGNKILRSNSRASYSNTDIPCVWMAGPWLYDITLRNNVAGRAIPAVAYGGAPSGELVSVNNATTAQVIDTTTFPTGWVTLTPGVNVGKTI